LFTIIKRKFHNLISDQKFTEILTGSVWAFSARVISVGLGLAASIIIARCYGADVMGIVAVIQSFLILATIFTVFGTNTSLLRLIPEHLVKYSPTSAFKVYRKTQFMVVFISLLTGTLFFISADLIAAKVFSKPHLSFYIALASAFVVFKSLMLLNTQAVRGLCLIKMFALMQFLPQGFNLFLLILIGFLWPTRHAPIYALLGGFAMTGLFGWIIMEYAFKKKIKPEDKVCIVSSRQILSISLPMLMTETMTFIIGQTGVIMLGIFRSEAEVGYYAIALKLATLTTFFMSSVNTIAAPKFSELFHSDNINEVFYVAKKSTKLIFWTTTPILLFLILCGKLVIYIIYGSEFQTAYLAMVPLVIGQFINSISGATGMFLNMTGSQRIYRNIMFMAAIININSNFMLTPKYGILGSAISAMISLVAWNLATLYYIYKKFGQTTGYFPKIF
jgi:O-antigen/teichoic acid export membrane protein